MRFVLIIVPVKKIQLFSYENQWSGTSEIYLTKLCIILKWHNVIPLTLTRSSNILSNSVRVQQTLTYFSCIQILKCSTDTRIYPSLVLFAESVLYLLPIVIDKLRMKDCIIFKSSNLVLELHVQPKRFTCFKCNG